MSVPATEGQEEAVGIIFDGDTGFAAFMETLAPEPNTEEKGSGDKAAGANAGAAGGSAPSGEASGKAAGAAGAGAAGDAGVPPVPPGTDPASAGSVDAGAGGRAAGIGTVDFKDIQSAFGEVSVALEESTLKAHQETALTAVRTDYRNYFDALQKHPRMLVGSEVPSLRGEGTETLRDSADAKEWQEAVKALLSDEIKERATVLGETQGDMMRTLHSSIELFQNNSDLVPGTKQFDKQLADEVMKIAKPYELRVDGKLHGFTIPIQPLVEQVRAQLVEKRATPPPAAQAAPGSTGAATPAQTPAAPVHTPQAGLQSRAGASTEAENFDTLWATLGGMRV